MDFRWNGEGGYFVDQHFEIESCLRESWGGGGDGGGGVGGVGGVGGGGGGGSGGGGVTVELGGSLPKV